MNPKFELYVGNTNLLYLKSFENRFEAVLKNVITKQSTFIDNEQIIETELLNSVLKAEITESDYEFKKRECNVNVCKNYSY